MSNIPDQINEVYQLLWQQVASLAAKWEIFNQLYGSQEAVALLNRSAPYAFRVIQDTLLDDVILALGRLTDPARSHSHDNLSLALLAERIDATEHPELKGRVLAVKARLEHYCQTARQHRNRRIAHSDLGAHLELPGRVLANISKAEIDQALAAVAELLNEVEGTFDDSETAFCPILTNDGETLLQCLRDAEVQRQERRQAKRHASRSDPT